MSSSKKPRPRMQVGPLINSAASATTPPSLTAGFTSSQFQSQLRQLQVADIQPRPQQPRRHFNAEGLEQLTQSVRNHGILQPLSVRLENGKYELFAGERRLRAARAAGLPEVPVRIFEGLSDAQVQQLAALENLQREDLNPVDEADAVMDILSAELEIPRNLLTGKLERWKGLKLRDPELLRVEAEERKTIEKLEHVFQGLSRGAWTSFVSNRLPVLRLPELLLQTVRNGELDYTKAIAIRSAPAQLHRQLILQAKQLSIHELRKAVRAAKQQPEYEDQHGILQMQLTNLRQAMTQTRVQELAEKERRQLQQLLEDAQAILDKQPGKKQEQSKK